MKVLAIVQARMGSSRLPGKVLRDLSGRTVLARVVHRAARAQRIHQIIVATTTEAADDAVVRECDLLDVPCFRGSEQDVLDRYYHAAAAFAGDVIVRLTADCPLIDPGVIDTTVAAFLAEPCDYASNSLALTYPRGLDVEVFTRGALNCAWSEAQQPYQRSHVTPFLYEHPDRFKVLSVTREKDYGSLRWTLDTPEDLRLIETIYQRFGGSDNFKEEDVLGLFAREPTLALINAHIRQKALLEG